VTDPEHACARLAFTEYARPGIVTRSYHSATTFRGVTDPAHALAIEAFTKNAWSGIVGLIVIGAGHTRVILSVASAAHALILSAFPKNTNFARI
jgi:hypothetical protein